jgi:hypothetical protein
VNHVVENPFLILGASPTAPRLELEREAQKLLGMLELGLASAATYDTPLGPRPRTPELVRAAIATLRDPAKRLAAELWASSPDLSPLPISPSLGRRDGEIRRGERSGEQGFPDAMVKLGWRRG